MESQCSLLIQQNSTIGIYPQTTSIHFTVYFINTLRTGDADLRF